MENDIQPEEYLRLIIDPLVISPFTVARIDDERGILLTLSLNKDDIGKIIGKGGATARAIRLIVRNYGVTRDLRIAVKIADPTPKQSND